MMVQNDFRTHYDRQRIPTCCGDRIRKEYEMRIDPDGFEYWCEIGETDQYEEIQSHKMSVDINYLIARYSAGDFDALNRRQAVYGDFTTAPKSFADMLNQVRDAQHVFDRLPVDVKQRFGNSFEQWLSSYGTKDWSLAMGVVPEVKTEPVSNVNEEVSE